MLFLRPLQAKSLEFGAPKTTTHNQHPRTNTRLPVRALGKGCTPRTPHAAGHRHCSLEREQWRGAINANGTEPRNRLVFRKRQSPRYVDIRSMPGVLVLLVVCHILLSSRHSLKRDAWASLFEAFRPQSESKAYRRVCRQGKYFVCVKCFVY